MKIQTLRFLKPILLFEVALISDFLSVWEFLQSGWSLPRISNSFAFLDVETIHCSGNHLNIPYYSKSASRWRKTSSAFQMCWASQVQNRNESVPTHDSSQHQSGIEPRAEDDFQNLDLSKQKNCDRTAVEDVRLAALEILHVRLAVTKLDDCKFANGLFSKNKEPKNVLSFM